MSKLIVSANSYKHLNELIKKNIGGIILYIDKLSVNGSFYIDVDKIDEFISNKREVFVSLNKIMHNSDLEYLRIVMNKLRDKDVKIMFYDMAVYNIAKEYNMIDKLVIYQDHLNASILSNNFYSRLGINYSYVTNDITGKELLEIKEKSGMKVMFTTYGYTPIFYSRRYLISSYLKYVSEKEGNKYNIVSDTNVSYPIEEEEYGTTVYSSKPINLINYIDILSNIDYLVLHSNMISDSEFNKMVDKYISREKIDNTYIGFFNTKTVYKVK